MHAQTKDRLIDVMYFELLSTCTQETKRMIITIRGNIFVGISFSINVDYFIRREIYRVNIGPITE